MTELEVKLQQIWTEKQDKIKPENIKKDIQIFDITGTYEGNSGGVKLFETEEQMQQDPNANEGDLAIVYREEISNMLVDSQVQYITFPETVTLPQALTESYYCRLRATDPSKMFDGNIMLDQNSFRFDGYSESDMIRVQYSSSDGITYTRTRFSGDSGDLTNPVDLGTVVQCEPMEGEWNDNFGYFMLIGGNTFEGLFEYGNITYKDKIKFSPLSAISFDYDGSNISNISYSGETVGDIYSLESIINMYSKIKNEVVPGNDFIEFFLNSNYELCVAVPIKSYVRYFYLTSELQPLGFGESGNTLEGMRIYKIDLEYETYTLLESVNGGGNGSNYYNPYSDISTIPILISGTTSAPRTSYIWYISSGQGTSTKMLTVDNVLGTYPLYNTAEYQVATTQLTTTKDLVYNSTYYGRDGINEGILTQNVSNSFADINAEVYYKIQQVYDNMEPRILTDDDKTIDKSIYFIPIKPDGTPLLDTSNVTDMNNMFQSCTNLQTIPKLDTNNVTNMMAMLQNCFGLTAISQLDTSQVTNTSHMFQNCTSLTTIPLLNTSSVTDMQFMFNGCTNLTTVPELDTSQATNMSYMFSDCTNLQTIPELDTSQATNMNYMFKDSFNLITIPLLDTSQASTIAGMFQNCTNLQAIPELNTSKVYDISYMFMDCTNLTTVPLLDLSHISFMPRMFKNCSSLSEESLNNILAMCINVQFLHSSNKTLQYIGLSKEQAQKCTTLSNWSALEAKEWTTGY